MSRIETIEPIRLRSLNAKKKVAAYARVSMETDALLHSLAAQVDYYTRKIRSNPAWEYAGVYADEGISGTSTAKRKEFNRLMQDCEEGEIDIILTKSISRFARDTVDCLVSVRRLKAIGVEVIFERENISSLDSGGEVMLTILASMAQAESESISQNVKWSVRKRFKQGIPNGHTAPYGYRWDGEMFRIIPEQGEIVKRIYARYLEGATDHQITKELKAEGVCGQTGALIDASLVRRILTSSSYAGKMILQKYYMAAKRVTKKNKGELPMYVVEGLFEPLVSDRDLEQALELRARRAEGLPNLAAKPVRFSGLVRCGYCGRGVSRRTLGGKRRWVCNTRERKGIAVCDMLPVFEDELISVTRQVVGDVDDDSFRRLVDEIVIYGDRIEMHMADGKKVRAPRDYSDHPRTVFSEKLFCGTCGRMLVRDSWSHGGVRKYCWIPRYRNGCTLKRLREAKLRLAVEEVLGTKEFEPLFAEKIKRAAVYDDRIEFTFREGRVETWQLK